MQNLTPGQQIELKALYPLGFSEAMMRIDKPNGDFFYAVSFPTEEIDYLVKIKVKIDDSSAIDDDKDLFDDQMADVEEVKGEDESDEMED
ncbi:MAG: hypothetical protein SNH41_07145 [Rikenellaceae bacterium]